MQMTAGRLFKELAKSKWKPLNLIVGEEPFQIREILDRFRSTFFKDKESSEFSLELLDGANLSLSKLYDSLQQLPGLFDDTDTRLIVCRDLDKLGESNLQQLMDYFADPVASTCFVATAAKVKKKSKWVSALEKNGYLIEVHEPFERDWPKWKGYFEQKIGKQISSDAWLTMVEYSDRKLSPLWMEVQKLATFVGEKKLLELNDVFEGGDSRSLENVFAFGESVLSGDRFRATKVYLDLVANGENDIKIMSILVRQYRLLWQCLKLKERGNFDAASAAKQLGAHPYFITKLLSKSGRISTDRVKLALNLLSECDTNLKVGRGRLFEGFCMPFLSDASSGLGASRMGHLL